MRNLVLPPKYTNFLKRLRKQREICFSLQDSKRPKGLRLFDFFPNKRLCPFVGTSVRQQEWKSGITSIFEYFLRMFECVWESWAVGGGWMPLRTRPQRYCDSASLVKASCRSWSLLNYTGTHEMKLPFQVKVYTLFLSKLHYFHCVERERLFV